MKRIIKYMMGITAGIVCTFWLLSGAVLAAESVDGHAVNGFSGAMAALQTATVRLGPAVSYPELGTLQAGQAVNVCGQADTGWYQIVYGAGIGYVSDKLLAQVPVDDTMREALAAQAAFVKQNAQAAQMQEQEAALAAGMQEQQAVAQMQEQAAAAQPEEIREQTAASVPAGGGNVIFVGDSRTGQMSNAIGGPAAYPGTAFVSCYGGGNEWLSTQQAKKEIDRFVTPGSIIIVNYGVNDLSKHNEYIATINKYNQDWRSKGAIVYFATVGPVGENEFGKRNWAVEYFNNQLCGRLDGSIGRIDLYSYLVMNGYIPTADGMHYSPDTYAGMFQFLMQSVGKG